MLGKGYRTLGRTVRCSEWQEGGSGSPFSGPNGEKEPREIRSVVRTVSRRLAKTGQRAKRQKGASRRPFSVPNGKKERSRRSSSTRKAFLARCLPVARNKKAAARPRVFSTERPRKTLDWEEGPYTLDRARVVLDEMANDLCFVRDRLEAHAEIFDQGYVTVTMDHRFRVSRRLKPALRPQPLDRDEEPRYPLDG